MFMKMAYACQLNPRVSKPLKSIFGEKLDKKTNIFVLKFHPGVSIRMLAKPTKSILKCTLKSSLKH